jgi:predicted TPR repeat methyltransferase
LSNDAACYDLILSADVFVYVGKLDEVFCCCEKSLRPHGMLAFSIELLSQGEQDYYLHGGGRYSHSKAYIERLAATASLSILAYNETILRKEKGADVAGAVFVLAKPAPGG